MSRATDAAFDALHALLADSMTEELRRDLERARAPRMIPDPDNEGKLMANPEWAPLSPKLLAVIRAFLKDNGIDTPASSRRFDGLVNELRDLDLDDPNFQPEGLA
jgi:hypothetical protein